MQDHNPYAPSSVESTASTESELERLSARPVGVSMVAGLVVLLGVMYLVGRLAIINRLASGGIGGPAAPSVARICFGSLVVAPFYFASGVGLWRGRRWGWWLTAVGFMGAIEVAIWVIFQLNQVMAGSGMLRGQLAVRFALAVAVLVYLLRDRVLAYCGVTELQGSVARRIAALPALGLLGMIYRVIRMLVGG